MAYASRSGRAITNASSPAAFGVCDRCGMWENHRNLEWQYQWRGASLQNIRILVCRQCLDTPSEQLRSIVVPADPTPVLNARVEYFLQDETDYQTVTAPTVYDPNTGIPIPSTTTLIGEDGQDLTTQVIGTPNGLEQGAVMPLNNSAGFPVEYGEQLPILSVISNGIDQVYVTCYSPHGLETDKQISVEGLSNARADGFYSVVVTTATAFRYQTYGTVPAGSLLTSESNIITCLVGLPLGYDQIPLTEPDNLLSNLMPTRTGSPIGLLLALTYP